MVATINNWPLARKMLAAFAAISILMVAVAATGIASNMRLAADSDRLITRGLAGSVTIGQILDQLREQRIILYTRQNTDDAAEIASLADRLKTNQEGLVAGVDGFRSIAGEGVETEVKRLATAVNRLNGGTSRRFALRAQDPAASLALIKNEGRAQSLEAIEAAEQLQQLTIGEASANSDESKKSANSALIGASVLSGIALLGLVGIWLIIARTVAAPMAALAKATADLSRGADAQVPSQNRNDELGQIARAVQSFTVAATHRAQADAAAAAEQARATQALGETLRALSQGDLTQRVTADFAPAFESLKTDLNQALSSMSGLIGSVDESVHGIRTGSHEIAQASEDLARRTESNAASLEETSAALVEIETRLRATAVSAKGTVARADQAIASVGTGRTTAEGAMQAMTRVSSSAKGIDSVIEGVDKIAFQTRVLAMNAAVEAGRAGDAGRGFAVVADLVSALAMRAEEEAKRARDQLTVTQAEIVTAVDAVQKVDGALSDISGDVDAVHKLLASMADDNLAQSAAITQISSAVGSMDKATQQNAAMVEETSAAARNLTVEVEALSAQAGQFVTGAGVARVAAPPARRPKPNGAARPAARQAAAQRPAANDPPKARANGHAMADASDWSDF